MRFRRPKPAPSDVQHDMLDMIARGLRDGTMTDHDAAFLADAMGPVRGSFGDWDRSAGRCHHMAPYPGCTGGCRT